MNPYQYVVLRCVPRVDREEFVNVGVVLHCQAGDFLDVASHVDPDRVRAVVGGTGGAELETVCAGLEAGLAFVRGVCHGDPALGEIASDSLGARFGFLRAPRSTVLQPGPVHGGQTADPAVTLADLLERLVR